MEHAQSLEDRRRALALELEEATDETRCVIEDQLAAVESQLAGSRLASERARAAAAARAERTAREAVAAQEAERRGTERRISKLKRELETKLAQVQAGVEELEPLIEEAIRQGDELAALEASQIPDPTRRALGRRSRVPQRIGHFVAWRLSGQLPNLRLPPSSSLRHPLVEPGEAER